MLKLLLADWLWCMPNQLSSWSDIWLPAFETLYIISSVMSLCIYMPCHYMCSCWCSTYLNSTNFIPMALSIETVPLQRTSQLLQGVSQGFRIGFAYDSVRLKLAKQNLLGTCSHPEIVEEYLQIKVNLHNKGSRTFVTMCIAILSNWYQKTCSQENGGSLLICLIQKAIAWMMVRIPRYLCILL